VPRGRGGADVRGVAAEAAVIILAVDPGRVVGFALFDSEILLRFGQFSMLSKGGAAFALAQILAGDAGYPLPPRRYALRPALAILEEGSVRYHEKHRGGVGEHKMYRDMMTNTAYRRTVAAVLLHLGVPSLGVCPEEWGAAKNVALRARVELARANIEVPPNFDLPAREHERDAIVLGGWCARRKVWGVDRENVLV